MKFDTSVLVSDALAIVCSTPALRSNLSDVEFGVFIEYATDALEHAVNMSRNEDEAFQDAAREGVTLRLALRALNEVVDDLDSFTRMTLIRSICKVLERVL